MISHFIKRAPTWARESTSGYGAGNYKQRRKIEYYCKSILNHFLSIKDKNKYIDTIKHQCVLLNIYLLSGFLCLFF